MDHPVNMIKRLDLGCVNGALAARRGILATSDKSALTLPDAAVACPTVVAEVLQRLHSLAAELDEHGGEVE